MQQLLMIAYYFPPLGGAGVQRSAKFAKYLAQFGWQLQVVAAEPAPFEPVDQSLAAEIADKSIIVTRIANREPFRGWDRLPGGWRVRALLQDWFLLPDRMTGWLQPALEAADRICREHPGIPAFTTSAPYTGHLVGLELKRRYQCRWITDFRDEWTQNPYLKYPTPFHCRKHRQMERQVLQNAEVIISVTEPITAGLHHLAPDSKAVFATIPNGFDPDDLEGRHYQRKPYFLMTHVGSLNRDRAELVRPLIIVLKKMISAGQIGMNDLRLRFIGPGSYQSFQNLPFVEIGDSLPHAAALDIMAQSDLLILAEANPAAFTGKIFEYLGLNRPILGCRSGK